MSDCTVCNNSNLLEQATCDEKSFRWNILKSLCYVINLLTVEETTVIPSSVFLPQVPILSAALNLNFTPINLLDTTKQLKHIRVINSTDADLEFTFDNSIVAFTVPAFTTFQDDFNVTLGASSLLAIRIASGMTAGIGKVLIEGRY